MHQIRIPNYGFQNYSYKGKFTWIIVGIFLSTTAILYCYCNQQMFNYYENYTMEYKERDYTIKSNETSNTRRESPTKLNVLLLVADDLRPQLNMYRGPYNPNPNIDFTMHTPSLDRLAERSLVFTRAYAQFSVCGPSRTSFLTGRRPDTTHVYDLSTYWRKAAGNFTTIPQFYKEQGYVSMGLGKIYHPGKMNNFDDPPSWTEPNYHSQFNWMYVKDRNSWESVPLSERTEKPLPDEDMARKARERLRTLAPKATTGEQPFFMAVGFHKPHLPFVCPEETFQLYPLESLKTPSDMYFPKTFPEIHWVAPEPGHYPDMEYNNCSGKISTPFCKLPMNETQLLRRAYFACVSYVDHMVGELMDELEVLGLKESTIVGFIGDHGYHLGENGMYGKHTNMEQSTHVPFMLSIPGRTDNGIVSNSVVELVDLFPTLVEASGFDPLSFCPSDSKDVTLCTEGLSLLPLVEDPTQHIKDVAVSQMTRFQSMGYSIRTDRYRYNEWPVIEYNETKRDNLTSITVNFWETLHGRELYDFNEDPLELENRASHLSYEHTVQKLSSKLHEAVDIGINIDYLYNFYKYHS